VNRQTQEDAVARGVGEDDAVGDAPGARHSVRLRQQFGEIDVYLFDQLLKGRFDACRRILDAGCGSGRNLVYFLRTGFDVFAADRDAAAVRDVRALARELAPSLPPDHVQLVELDALPWPDESMDAVLASAVLHFATDERHFGRVLDELWRVLARGGLFWARLASSIGIEGRVHVLQGRRARLPDGTERFLVDEGFLLQLAQRLGAELVEPIKTTNVQNLRAMTTWCVRKPT
jgi:tellurite methyltransferase